MKEVKVVDLFAGMGGLRLGMEQAIEEKGYKMRCILTSEIKEYAVEALKSNFGHERFEGDVRGVETGDMEDFDILLAGFPCQAFSVAGKGMGFSETRGTLFFEVERILRDKRPYGFILENVEGLVTHDRKSKKERIGNTLETILRKLEGLGYKVEWRVLEGQEFGVPQVRKRVFIVGTQGERVDLEGFKKERRVVEEILEEGKPVVDSEFTRCLLANYGVEELNGKSIKDKRGGAKNIHSWDIGLKGEVSERQKRLMVELFKERRKKHWAEEIGIEWMDGMPLTLEQIGSFWEEEGLREDIEDLEAKGYVVKEYPKGKVEKEGEDGKKRVVREQDRTKEKGYNIVAGQLSFEFTRILDKEGYAPTLVATDVGRIGVVDGRGIRRLTIREGLRMFGYPESYKLEMEERKAYDLLGNTVVVPVVYEVSKRLVGAYERDVLGK